MTQLIATNQLTLTNVNDGQTPVVHWAYSDNADGTGNQYKTGKTVSVSASEIADKSTYFCEVFE